MTCTPIKLDNGGVAIVCTPRQRAKRCSACGRAARLLCDWKIGDGKTCDKPICAMHAQEVGEDKHLCPEHQEQYRAWLARRETAAHSP